MNMDKPYIGTDSLVDRDGFSGKFIYLYIYLLLLIYTDGIRNKNIGKV